MRSRCAFHFMSTWQLFLFLSSARFVDLILFAVLILGSPIPDANSKEIVAGQPEEFAISPLKSN